MFSSALERAVDDDDDEDDDDDVVDDVSADVIMAESLLVSSLASFSDSSAALVARWLLSKSGLRRFMTGP